MPPLRACMVEKLDDWPWSSWPYTIGKYAAPSWLATDALLNSFGERRATAINAYIKFVYQGVQKRIWDDLKHQIYLGDEDFVKQHQALQQMSDGDLSEVPSKQRRPIAKSLSAYQQESATRDEAIRKAYRSGGYTQKQIGEHFGIHYSLVSRIISKKDKR